MTGRVWVVDPIATNRIILRAKLSAAYWDVTVARSVDQVTQMMADGLPDIVILSDTMSSDTLFALCRTLRAADGADTLAILVLAQDAYGTAADAALGAGADDVLPAQLADPALMRRLRTLRRDQAERRDLSARLAPLGQLAEPPNGPANPVRISVMSENPSRAAAIAHALWLDGPFEAETTPIRDVLAPLSNWSGADIVVLDAPDAQSDLPKLTALRAHSGARHASILVALSDGTAMAEAFELGADTVAAGGGLTARINALLRRQRPLAALRRALDAGLAMAILDPLTGLHNRRYALTQLKRANRQTGGVATVLMLDLDHFKSVNDRYGHGTGDRVLSAVADALRQVCPTTGVTARIGGEEFLIGCVVRSGKEATELANTVRQTIANLRVTIGPGQDPIAVTASLGAALCKPDESLEGSLARADAALYRSKRAGRNRVTLDDAVAA